MRAVALLLLLFQTAPPVVAPFCARVDSEVAADCDDETHPAQTAPAPDPEALCDECRAPACPSQRVCTQTIALISVGIPVLQASSRQSVEFAVRMSTPASVSFRLFHPPRA